MDQLTALYMFQGIIQSILFNQSVKSRIKSGCWLINPCSDQSDPLWEMCFCHFVNLLPPNSIYRKTV